MTELSRTQPSKRKVRFFFKEWRKHRRLTQDELAAMVGVSASSISQLETGKQGFTDTTLIALSDALQCSPGDLLSINPLNNDISIDRRIAKLPQKQIDQIQSFVDFLINGPSKT